MHAIIDTPYNVGPYATRLFDEGVRSVIRYYNTENSVGFPQKCLTKEESKQLLSAGLTLGAVYQQRGGASNKPTGHIEDFSVETARRDGASALKNASLVKQPEGSAIYFGVDHDFYQKVDLDAIRVYFKRLRDDVGSKYRIGVYASGTVCRMLKAAGLAELFWLPRSMGWSGSRDFFRANEWTLFQGTQELRQPWGNFDYDANQFNPAFADFGQFTALQADEGAPLRAAAPFPQVAIFEVVAASGLQLRRGPGTEFASDGAVSIGTIVNGLRLENGWMQVDVSGDKSADGYMRASFLRPLAGGLPLAAEQPHAPYQFAQAELRANVREVPGPQSNPRIVLYHSYTDDGPAPDETAWCSSFANFCVAQAGMTGTRSKWARSWHDNKWGADVTANPHEGDIVVFRRKTASVDGGHVAFLVDDLGDRVRVLGGNQSDRVCISTYPKNGKMGSTHYTLLSIRR